VVARYQKRVFSHLMRLGIGFYNETRSGQLAARINENVAGIRDLLGMTLKSVVGDLVTLVGLIGVMVWQQPFLAASILVIGPPLVWAVNYIMRRVRRVTRESVEINSSLIGAMQEAVQGISVVKAFTMEDQLTAKIGELVDRAESRYNKIARVSERLTPVSEMLAGFAVAGVIAYAAYRAAVDSHPPGDVLSFITALLLAYDPARRLARTQVNVERALVNARMILRTARHEPQGDATGATEARITQGEVPFRQGLLRYYPGRAGAARPLLHRRAAGPRPSSALPARQDDAGGAAPSLHDHDSGTIEVDGQDIAKVTKRSLRRAIAYVSQQPYLFEGSIRDNIRYGRPDATGRGDRDGGAGWRRPTAYPPAAARIRHAGGRERRDAFGRAAPAHLDRAGHRAPGAILLLDEATSALDTESESSACRRRWPR